MKAWIIVVVLNAAAVGPVISSQISHVNPGPEVPLEFSDILPENPKSYDKMEPPKQQGKPTIVYFHVTVMSLDSIDESSMTYAADIFFSQMWQDYRLRFPDNLTADYRLLPTSWLRQMWRPDSFFKNAKKVTFQDITIPNHYIWLYKDKSILYMVKLTLILSCSMNFKLYPHDTQQCAMKIESLSHTTDDLVFVWEKNVPLAVDERIELPQLDLVSNLTGDCTQVYSTGNFTCLEIVFSFRRRLGYYLFHTYVPTCLIVIMSWISFWIRPEAVPARVTLGVTSLLTLSTQHANSQKSLPPVSYIKAIDIFMSGCTVFVFCSLMEYALVNIVMGDFIEGDDSALKRGMKSIFVASGFANHKHPTRESGKNLHSPQQSQQQQQQQQQPQQQQILRVSQSMLPVCSRSLQNEHHAQIHPIASSLESEMLRDPPHQPALIRRPVNSKEGNNGSNLNAILPDTPSASHPASANNYLISHGENGRPPAVPTLCGRTQQTEAPLGGSEGPKSSPFGLFSQPTAATLHQLRRNRAITIDRLSRLLFPVSFFILNAVYWSVFIDWS